MTDVQEPNHVIARDIYRPVRGACLQIWCGETRTIRWSSKFFGRAGAPLTLSWWSKTTSIHFAYESTYFAAHFLAYWSATGYAGLFSCLLPEKTVVTRNKLHSNNLWTSIARDFAFCFCFLRDAEKRKGGRDFLDFWRAGEILTMDFPPRRVC